MLVKEFKQKQGLRFPDEFLDCLPDYCLDERCGSPTEMSETLTGLRCSNPRCPTKVAKRITTIASTLGVKDLGMSRANDFVSKFGIGNPLLIFAYEPVDGELGYSISMDMSQKIFDQFATKRNFTLWEYVRIANLPYIQSSALHIFGDYDDLSRAYEDIEAGGVDFIQRKLSINKGTSKMTTAEVFESEDDIKDVSIRALKVYQSLMMFKADLFQALPFVNIIETHKDGVRTLKAVCSEQVGEPYRTKSEFYAAVNGMFTDIHVEFLQAVNKGIDYLIWAGAEDSSVRVTNKVKKVRAWNEGYADAKASGSLKDGQHEIPIVSAGQFIQILKGISNQ